MILNFTAEAVEIEENDLDVLCVGFYAEENYLMIQQSLDIKDSNYHIECDDQSFGGYGGVKGIKLSPNQIEVELDETGKENLQCDGVKVDFETNEETYQLLMEKLRLIFGNLLNVSN
jgi:hypothetical protein